MKSKKAAIGHVEMILSFILFVSFLLFLFIFLNPVKKSKISEFDLDFAIDKLVENISSELDYVSLSIDLAETSQISANCFSASINIEPGDKTHVINQLGENVSSVYSNGRISIEEKPDNYKRFYYIYSFPDFQEIPISGCQDLTSGFEIGARREINVLYDNKLSYINYSYFSNYDNLRRNLGIINDFGFIIYDLTKTNKLYDCTRAENSRLSLSKDKNFQILYSNGSINNVILNVQIW